MISRKEISTLRVFWSEGVTPERHDPFNIQAKDHASAKLVAGEPYRGQVFRARPDGYRLFN